MPISNQEECIARVSLPMLVLLMSVVVVVGVVAVVVVVRCNKSIVWEEGQR